MKDDMERFQSQAKSVDVSSATADSAPPDNNSTAPPGQNDKVEVLIVEQSETMRDELEGILSSQHVSTAHAVGVDEAIDVLKTHTPQLIISEFRMPTMAAKKLADSLRSSGKTIPVLVTTSQTGKTADMLVEKLGVSGYISKPISEEEVRNHLEAFVGANISP